MIAKILVPVLLVAALAACGSSEGDKVVMVDKYGKEYTYSEAVKRFSQEPFRSEVSDCAVFAATGSQEKGAKFPSGQSLFVKACEEGLKG